VPRYVALLRGINLGKRMRMDMRALRGALAGIGLADATTYLQSGNAIFTSEASEAELTARLEQAIADRFGLQVPCLVRTAQELRAVAAANPRTGDLPLDSRTADHEPPRQHLLGTAPRPHGHHPQLEHHPQARRASRRLSAPRLTAARTPPAACGDPSITDPALSVPVTPPAPIRPTARVRSPSQLQKIVIVCQEYLIRWFLTHSKFETQRLAV
jgi:hypothetical protein